MRPLSDVWKPVLQSASVGTVNRLALIGIRLVTVPLLVRHLGTERYGLWMAIASFTAYVTVLDFGVVSAVVNKLTDQFRLGRVERASTYIVASSALLAALAVVGGAVGLMLIWHVDFSRMLHLTSRLASQEAKPTLAVAIIMASLQLATSTLLRVPYTMQKGYLAEGYSLVGNAISLIGIIASVWLDAGLPYLAASLMAGPVLAALAVGAHLLIQGKLRSRVLCLRRMRAIVAILGRSASDFVVVQSIAAMLAAFQLVLLGIYRGAAEVAIYALLGQAIMGLQIPLAVLQQPLWTRIGALYRAGEIFSIKQLFVQYLRVAAGYSVGAGLVIVFLLNPLLTIVLGKSVNLSIDLRVAFAISCAIGLLAGGNLASLLFGMDLSRAIAVVSSVQFCLFLGLAALLTPRWGAEGMIWSINSANLFAIPLLARAVSARFSLIPSRNRQIRVAPEPARVQ